MGDKIFSAVLFGLIGFVIVPACFVHFTGVPMIGLFSEGAREFILNLLLGASDA